MQDQIFAGNYAKRRFWPRTGPIKLLNWNIERGQQLTGVVDFIEREQPDICIFQEVDLYARRTGRRHVADVLAARFEYNYVFGVEFEELSQGTRDVRALHGQAVFARFEMGSARILRFVAQSGFWRPRWYLPQWPVFQPRAGGRMALVVELDIGGSRPVIYDTHLESQGDDQLRLHQLNELTMDSFRYPQGTPVIVAGDFNTGNQPKTMLINLQAAGFEDACADRRCRGTKRNGRTLDWIFVRGPAACRGTVVHRNVTASDHYPLSTNLVLCA
jgi:endonuclease/exonuclease/phosphatase family metal-dependent hydrolase